MAITRWIPRSSLTGFRSELDRFFDNFFSGEEEETSLYRFTPSVDIEEGEKAYHVTAELPGVKKDDVKVTVKDNVLTINGEKKQKKEEKGKEYHRTERAYGSFQRCFRLPEMVDQENINAEFKDGMLEISIPKKEEAVSKEVNVNVK